MVDAAKKHRAAVDIFDEKEAPERFATVERFIDHAADQRLQAFWRARLRQSDAPHMAAQIEVEVGLPVKAAIRAGDDALPKPLIAPDEATL